MLGKNKRIFLPFFVLFGLFFAAQPALAFWKELGTWIVTRPFLVFGWLLVKTTILITGLAGSLLNWVLSPNFITLSYTNPARNIIIDTGLGITRGFVNMLLVLVLVYIAIATILRLAGYETKKLLVTFIIVALLVNFSPVICGLIVDASNIVMNFFVQDLRINVFGKTMGQKVADLAVGFEWETPLGDAWTRLVQLFIMSGFLLVLSFILFTLTIIFILRYLVIWLLVILSPLAFVCYILPITKKYWDLWWKQLLAWSFIGVTCGFFLYLGLLFVMHVPTSITAPTTGEGGPFDNILPFFVSTVFLGIGVIFGLQTSAMGASGIMGIAKTRGRRAAGWFYKKTRAGIAAGERNWIPRLIPAKDEEGKRQWGKLGAYFTTLRDVAGVATKAWERIPGLRWYRPERLRKFAEFRSAKEDMKKFVTGPSDVEMERVAYGDVPAGGARAAAIVDAIIRDRGDSQDFIETYAKKHGHYDYKKNQVKEKELFKDKKFLQDKTAIRALEFIKKSGDLGKVERTDPRLALIGRSEQKGLEKMTKAVVNAKPGDAAKWEREVAEDKQVMEIVLAFKDDNFFRTIGGLKGGVAARQRTINTLVSEFVQNKGLDPKNNEENWKEYMKDLQKRYNVLTPGIEKAISNPRFRSAGWGYEEKDKVYGGRYLTEEERGKPLGYTASGAAIEAGTEEKIKKEVKALRSIGEKRRQVQPLKGISEKRKEEQKLRSILEKRKEKKE